MTTKHTPGPWFIAMYGHEYFVSPQQDSDGKFDIAKVYFPNYHPTGLEAAAIETQANARLIAAAPELLAALREAEKSLDWAGKVLQVTYPDSAFSESLTAARAAIAKATQP